MSISVRVSGARRGLFGPYRFKTIAAAWAADVAPLVQEALKAKAPVAKVNGGRLRESIRHKQVNTASSATITFYSGVPYAKYVLDGTVEHEIRPKFRKALFWEGAAHPVGLVHHPGTKANDFPRRAITPLLPVIQGRFKQISVEALGGE